MRPSSPCGGWSDQRNSGRCTNHILKCQDVAAANALGSPKFQTGNVRDVWWTARGFFGATCWLAVSEPNGPMRRKADKRKPVPAPDIENSGSTLKSAAPRAPLNEVEPALGAVRSQAGALLDAPPSSSAQSPASAGMMLNDVCAVVVSVVIGPS